MNVDLAQLVLLVIVCVSSKIRVTQMRLKGDNQRWIVFYQGPPYKHLCFVQLQIEQHIVKTYFFS